MFVAEHEIIRIRIITTPTKNMKFRAVPGITMAQDVYFNSALSWSSRSELSRYLGMRYMGMRVKTKTTELVAFNEKITRQCANSEYSCSQRSVVGIALCILV